MRIRRRESRNSFVPNSSGKVCSNSFQFSEFLKLTFHQKKAFSRYAGISTNFQCLYNLHLHFIMVNFFGEHGRASTCEQMLQSAMMNIELCAMTFCNSQKNAFHSILYCNYAKSVAELNCSYSLNFDLFTYERAPFIDGMSGMCVQRSLRTKMQPTFEFVTWLFHCLRAQGMQ